MTGATLIWVAIAMLVVACFAATGVQSLRDFSRAKLRELLRRRNQEVKFDEILDYQPRAELGAESLRVLASAAAVVAAAAHLSNSQSGNVAWVQSLALLVVQLIAGAIVLWLTVLWFPAAAARVWAEPFLVRTWPLWRAAGKILAPSVFGAQLVERLLHRIAGKQRSTLTEEDLEEEIREVVSEGQREGLLEDDAREMIESVITLGEVMVSEIMTPRTEVISISVDLPWEEGLKSVINSGHTRIPVYGKNRDDIIGILHIKDLLPELMRESPAKRRPISELLRQAFFVPETKAVDELLEEFQQSRSHIAVVLDEYGSVAGVVTIEDVLEEIVGEIADEHDEAAIDGLKPVSENTYEMFARIRLDELNHRLNLNLPEDADFETIGGLVFHQLGRIPHAGEELITHGVRIKVLEATRRRINRVLVEVVASQEQLERAISEAEVPSSD